MMVIIITIAVSIAITAKITITIKMNQPWDERWFSKSVGVYQDLGVHVLWRGNNLLPNTHGMDIVSRHYVQVFKCPAMQFVQDPLPCLFSPVHCTMQLFMRQRHCGGGALHVGLS